ncbi:polyphosphate kinase [Marinobacteraceae bacterium S3BR75-40.1]
MESNPFIRQWHYDPQRPALADYPASWDDRTTLDALDRNLERIGEHHRRLWAHKRQAVLLVIHGVDASGKDSLIRTLARYADPAGFHAWSFGRPHGAEARHDFLWRTTPHLPAFGEIAAFNRSYHEAVMAERVWPVHAPECYDWEARFAAIRAFEAHLESEGTRVLKLWLRVSPEKHRQRLLKRLDKPRKQWKFDASDIEAWTRRHDYLHCVEQAIAATHTPQAPWLIIPDDQKSMARAIVARLLADTLETLAPDYPPVDEAVLAKYRAMLTESG